VEAVSAGRDPLGLRGEKRKMATLNITFGGESADFPLDIQVPLADDDVRRVAIEVVRAGGVGARGALANPALPDNAFDNFVIDRFEGGERIYLRPKVPFGAKEPEIIVGIILG
jgi:hypothetical protein